MGASLFVMPLAKGMSPPAAAGMQLTADVKGPKQESGFERYSSSKTSRTLAERV